jgi:hypothetical protein
VWKTERGFLENLGIAITPPPVELVPHFLNGRLPLGGLEKEGWGRDTERKKPRVSLL